MKIVALLATAALLCFGVSPTSLAAAEAPLSTSVSAEVEAWPGGNRKARRITKRARKRTMGITQFAALKVMKRRKAQRKKLKRAASRDKMARGIAPAKKTGCPN